MKNLKLFLIGAIGYTIIELLWRGHTHWTMTLTGGICFITLFHIFSHLEGVPLILKCFAGAAVITGIEFTIGCIVNICLHWNVWDYSSHAYHLLGQICPFYSFMWFLLCIPIFYLTVLIKKFMAL